METGQLSEWRATLLLHETACLSAADRCAAAERNVSLRPTPDTMCYLTVFLPVAEGVDDASQRSGGLWGLPQPGRFTAVA